MFLFGTNTAFAQSPKGNGTKESPYELSSSADWLFLANIVNTGKQPGACAKMDADLDLGTLKCAELVGTSQHPYTGTFDGGGHTLRIKVDNPDSANVAPFRFISGATIKNLHTKGKYPNVNKENGAGIVAHAVSKPFYIENCWSTDSIKSGATGVYYYYYAGIVAYADKGAIANITDCLFDGQITRRSFGGSTGILGYSDDKIDNNNISNCLIVGTLDGHRQVSSTDSWYGSVSNSYCLNELYGRTKVFRNHSTLVTRARLKSGEIAGRLQAGREKTYWVQMDTDDYPKLSFDTSVTNGRYHKVSFKDSNSGQETKVKYVKYGDTVPGIAIKDFVGNSYDDANFNYTIQFSDGFTPETAIIKDMAVSYSITKTYNGNSVEITSKQDWIDFSQKVRSSKDYCSLNAILTADIDLGTIDPGYRVGTEDNPYSGTFDGGGHTLTFSGAYADDSNENIAPFRFIAGATIENLNTSGTYTIDWGHYQEYDSYSSGIVGTAKTKPFVIENCSSDVNIIVKQTYREVSSNGGLVGRVTDGATATIKDCKFTGSIGGDGHAVNSAGIIGRVECPGSTISNTLMAGTFNLYNQFNHNSGTFVRADDASNVTITNCYYLNAVGAVQGTQVTSEQLKSGDVLKKLQGDRTDMAYWGQELGTDPMPGFFNEDRASDDNYVHYDADRQGFYCTTFHWEKDGDSEAHPLPIGIDFQAGSIKSGRTFTGTEAEPQIFTLCLPYGVDMDGQSFKAYSLKGLSADGKKIQFTEVTDGLAAATPYLLVFTADSSLANADGGMISSESPANSTVEGLTLHGSYTRLENDSLAKLNAYILQSDNLWHPVVTGNSAWLSPFRAYLTIDKSPTASAKHSYAMSLIGEDGMTTGIGSIETIDNDGTMKYYDLNGRYIGTSLDGVARGIYINSKGKKVKK